MKTQIVYREFFHEIFFQPHKTIWIQFISAYKNHAIMGPKLVRENPTWEETKKKTQLCHHLATHSFIWPQKKASAIVIANIEDY